MNAVGKVALAVGALSAMAIVVAACTATNDPSGGTPDEFANDIFNSYKKNSDGFLSLENPSGLLSTDERRRIRTESSTGLNWWGGEDDPAFRSESNEQIVSFMSLFTAADMALGPANQQVTVPELAHVIATYDANGDGQLQRDEKNAFSALYHETAEGPNDRDVDFWG